MAIELSQEAYWELVADTENSGKLFDPGDQTDKIWTYPALLGRGQFRAIQLKPGLELAIADYHLHKDVTCQSSDRPHPLELVFCLSGGQEDEKKNQICPGSYGLFGNGLAPGGKCTEFADKPTQWVSIHIEPELILSSFGLEENFPEFQHLFRSYNQKYYNRYQVIDSQILTVVHQIWNCPYHGLTKRLYLEGKVLELIALVLEQEKEIYQTRSESTSFKSEDIACLYHAKEILINNLENPPSLKDLAVKVGLNDYKLKLGFKQIFGTTAFAYLHQQRLEKARQLLAETKLSVSEIAWSVGFANRGYFAAAFKRKFSVNPGEYLKSVRK